MKAFKLTTVLVFLLSLSAFAQTDITEGTWYNEEKTGSVQFFLKDDKLHGKIVWMKHPEKKDKNNPDVKLRDQPILGLVNLTGFVSKDKKVWTDGKIYDPESGKTYSSKITVVSEKTLDVRGYIGTPLLGRSTKFIKGD